MTDDEFEILVREGIEAIPEPFRDKIENVAFLIEDDPSEEERIQMHLDTHRTLLGLYQGIPQTRRGVHYYAALPDRITIFKNPILAHAHHDKETVKQMVADTVWHEVGHHFGLNEIEVRKRQEKRTHKKTE